MKVNLIAVLITILTIGSLGIAQDLVSDVGKAAEATGHVTEKAATTTAHGTVKAPR